MDSSHSQLFGEWESLPSPPPTIPPDIVSLQADSGKSYEIVSAKRVLMPRRGLGSEGQKIQLLTNHFRVDLRQKDVDFYHYNVAILYEDNRPANAKGIGRKIIEKVYETYGSDLGSMDFAYDGEKSLFTVGSLSSTKFECTVILDEISSIKVRRNGSPDRPGGDSKRMRRQSQSKTFKVEISYAERIPLQAILDALHGQESEQFQEALRVLDIILRQHAAKQGCLHVRQSFFHDQPRNYAELGGGVQCCRGFHSSFRATQGGLSLNIDVSTTMLLKPGPVVDFLCMNQDVKDHNMIDWNKEKRMLKNLRIKVNNLEYRITGLSDEPCSRQTFSFRQGRDANGEVQSIEITVLEYFENFKHIPLRNSADMPCINVGKPKRPTYFPVEFCSLVSLQRYTKALTNSQRANLVERSRQKPKERMEALSNSLRNSRYENDPMLRSSGVTIDSRFTQVEGRVLQAPTLRVGDGRDLTPRGGRWNFNNRKLADPVEINKWAIVNFTEGDISRLLEGLKNCSRMKGINMTTPFRIFKENPEFKSEPAPVRVDRMYEKIKEGLPAAPQLLLCILPKKKNSDIYGPWKRRNLCDEGVVTQCIAPTQVNDQYITNVLLKINAKLGGMNSFLSAERSQSIRFVSQRPTLILGMDVSHGSPGNSDVPSIAAVVSSRYWPQISSYRAAVRTQSPKVEIIANLFKPVSDTEDHGIIRELLEDFKRSSNGKPNNTIIFRDGVSESQFNQVLNIELDQIIQACKLFDESWDPKFTLIVAQKNHHTRFFQVQNQQNAPPGTVIDKKICHPRSNDFYMCAHAGMIGTTRPTHYHVLYDEIGFSADDLQELVHSLSYVYQRSTTAISVVAPICYAHLAAAQMGQFIKFDEFSESSSSHGGGTSARADQIPELPPLHQRITNTMFFC